MPRRSSTTLWTSDRDTASIIEIVASDSYTYTLSGLDAVNRFDVAATAIRGNEIYFNRWTLVSIEGAESFTSLHSEGTGIVTDGLAENQVAVWTPDQISWMTKGLLRSGWISTREPTANFEIVSQQYTGPHAWSWEWNREWHRGVCGFRASIDRT